MHIGLNLLYLLPGVVGGTETYAVSLLRALAALGGDDRYTAYVNREAADLDLVDAPNVDVSVCDVSASSRSARYAYEQFRLPAHVRRDGVDVLHSLGYVGPFRTSCPHVVTIHDLIYAGFGEFMPTRRRRALQVFVRGIARRADRIITVSEASKAQIVTDIGVDPDRVTVVYEAPRPDIIAADDGEQPGGAGDDDVLRVYRIERPYVVAFSSLSPSKNIPRLVEALASLGDDPTWRLVLIGHVPDGGDVSAAIARWGVADRIVTTGYVPDAHVGPLVRNAEVFVFPSLYEGFGLPAVEAQVAGVPLACSTAASLPEVAGDGALFFDPHSVDGMAGAIRRLLTERDVRRVVIERGRQNASRFSWERAAAETRDVYRHVASGGRAAGDD